VSGQRSGCELSRGRICIRDLNFRRFGVDDRWNNGGWEMAIRFIFVFRWKKRLKFHSGEFRFSECPTDAYLRTTSISYFNDSEVSSIETLIPTKTGASTCAFIHTVFPSIRVKTPSLDWGQMWKNIDWIISILLQHCGKGYSSAWCLARHSRQSCLRRARIPWVSHPPFEMCLCLPYFLKCVIFCFGRMGDFSIHTLI
jgi:hypothetical protein